MSMALDMQTVQDFVKDSSKHIGQSFQAAQGIPETQKDIAVLARAAEQAQSPAVQQEIKALRSEAETVAMTALALQALSTVAIVIVAINTFSGDKK